MRIVLDTGTLYRPPALHAARAARRPLVLPAVALAERLRQLRRDGHDPERFRSLLHDAGAVIEAFDDDTANQLPPGADDAVTWRKHARDALIAAHMGPHDELWTTNPRDFEALGVPATRIRAW